MRRPLPQLVPFFVAALLVALWAVGCSTSPLSRIDAKRSVYESWPIDIQDAVYHGKVLVGMTAEMVEMALGKPTEVTPRGGDEEIWSYKKSSGDPSSLLGGGGGGGSTGVSIGGGIGGVGIGTSTRRGRSATPSDAEDQDITFKNGVVTRVS